MKYWLNLQEKYLELKETLYENTRNWWSKRNQPTFYLTIIAYLKNEPKNNKDDFVEVETFKILRFMQLWIFRFYCSWKELK